jgi:crossover junction endonuclease MUS81
VRFLAACCQLELTAERARRPATSTTRTAGDELDDIVGTGSEADDPPPPPKKKRKPTNTKAYIPQLGSGPYGILLGLLLSISDARVTIQAFLTKGELIRAAQPYCNSSYDHSERGTFVTAWNGMKTLINKGYVVVQGSPHRYCLTEDG